MTLYLTKIVDYLADAVYLCHLIVVWGTSESLNDLSVITLE